MGDRFDVTPPIYFNFESGTENEIQLCVLSYSHSLSNIILEYTTIKERSQVQMTDVRTVQSVNEEQ